MDIALITLLTVLGAFLMFVGREGFTMGWYGEYAFAGFVGTLAFLFGLFGFACLLWPEQMRILLIGY